MQYSMATKISLVLAGMLALAVFSGVVAILSARQFESQLRTVVHENLASVRAAEELEVALSQQRGYVSAYILDDGNRKWLDQLEEKRESFDYWMDRARTTARSGEERRILDELDEQQLAYAIRRDEVVELYNAGEEDKAKQLLLSDIVALYDRCYALCEQFIDSNQRLVDASSDHVRQQVQKVAALTTISLVVMLVLGLGLLGFFLRGVILPLRRLATEARSAAGETRTHGVQPRVDELRELGRSVKMLMADVTLTRTDLQDSRDKLALAENLAAVGKLAACVAHEIRNPLTSIKMWVYSLRRAIGHDEGSRQKLAVISDELGRLEGIVQNFLEFSRPPPLNLRRQPIQPIIDKSLAFLGHTLEDHRIRVTRHDCPNLPEIMVDEEQLAQVLLNLVKNSIEALPHGGQICLSTGTTERDGRELVTLQLRDSGPGIPDALQTRVFEPFFTTKEHGTGLGLCIAASVMARHGGSLELEESSTDGTVWRLVFPACT